MNSDSIVITAATLKSLPNDVQEAIFGAMLNGTTASAAPPPATASDDEDDENLAQLSPSQAREFYSGCGEKTRRALEVIAKSPSHQFHIADVASALGVGAGDMRSVWGGLTRRLYTVLGDRDAYLINWEPHDPVLDDEEKYVDHIGEVSEMTHQSFRKLLVK